MGRWRWDRLPSRCSGADFWGKCCSTPGRGVPRAPQHSVGRRQSPCLRSACSSARSSAASRLFPGSTRSAHIRAAQGHVAASPACSSHRWSQVRPRRCRPQLLRQPGTGCTGNFRACNEQHGKGVPEEEGEQELCVQTALQLGS